MRDMEFWVLPNFGFDTAPTVKEQLTRFRRNNAGMRVTARVRTQRTMWERLLGILKNPAGRKIPDVVQIPSHWTSTLAHLGLLHDISDLDRDLDLRVFEKPLQENCRLTGGGRIYSVPWWTELRVLYYRIDALKKIGQDPEVALANWDALRRTCRELSRHWKVAAGRFPMANPNPRESVSMSDIAPCIWSRGGEFFSPDGSRSLFARSDAFGGIGEYFSLLNAGWMPLIGQNGLPPGDLFSGHCALQFSGRFPMVPTRARAKSDLMNKLGAVPMPKGGGQSASVLNCYNLAVLREGENPRQAYSLVRELTREGAATDYARAIGAFSPYTGAISKCVSQVEGFQDVFSKALAGARTLPNLRMLGTVEKVFDRSMDRLVREVMTKTFNPRVLRSELIHSAAEIDYVLSLYD
jgi:multiple sugar transport system substrate-binding protein